MSLPSRPESKLTHMRNDKHFHTFLNIYIRYVYGGNGYVFPENKGNCVISVKKFT